MSLSVLGIVAKKRTTIRTDAPTLVLTIESAVALVTSRGGDLVLDRSGCLVLPSDTRVAVRASTAAGRVAVLAFREPVFALVARTYAKLGVRRDRLERQIDRVELLPRTVWIHEIVHRYLFERHALGEHDNVATRFLETEILKELHFLFRDREAGADRATIVRKHTPCVERAVAYLESNLFEPCDVAALASHAGGSQSTLLRAFRRELGCTPGAYWRRRKLDEALGLLRSGVPSIAEVATQVGYDNPTSFAYAFRRRFGKAPSSFRPRRPLRPAP